ncbi:MAG TPA: DNA polymerase IV [Chitinophagaceae bacterium]|nr:DNA polymerase IV [Chitinophagaceae bacterium]
MMIEKERQIAHLDLDAFFVSVECLRNSKLRGKPLIVGGSGDRGVVSSCSYEARRFGIHSAMPVKLARRLCPDILVIRGDMECYSYFSRMVTEIIQDTVPLFEKSSIDEFYIDMTGLERYFGSNLFITGLRRKIMRESGLPVSYGLASNKLVSKVATNEIKPNGQIQIPFGTEKQFLSPLAVNKIPGIGSKTSALLCQMGVETVKLLSEIPMEMLQHLLGKPGTELWRKANGIDETPVIPYQEQKSISTEQTFQQDSIDLEFLRSTLTRMTEKIAFELRSQQKLTGCVTVKIRYSNFDTVTRQKSIAYSNVDHFLIQTARDLFEVLYNRRLRVRLIGIRFTHLIAGHYQIKLYEDNEEMIRLYQAIDSVKQRFGENLLSRASGV